MKINNMSKHLSSKYIKKTKKKHECCECFRTIDEGEECKVDYCADMGSVYSFYQCDVCIAFLQQLTEEDKETFYFFSEELRLRDIEGYGEFAAEYAINKLLKS